MLTVNMCTSYFQYDLAVEMTLSNKPSSRTNFDLVNNYSWQILMTANHNQKRGSVYHIISLLTLYQSHVSLFQTSLSYSTYYEY